MNANRFSIRRRIACWFVAAGLVSTAAAFQNLESTLRRNGASVMNAFEPVRQVLQTSSAVLLDGRREVAYGTVVSADGLILTKASEIEEVKKLTVRIDQREWVAAVLGKDAATDLALLKVPATDLVPVKWNEKAEIPQGTWVVANGATSRSRRRALAGIISAKPREIKASGGAGLGVVLDADVKSLRIGEVMEGSGAKTAGLKKGDVILAIDGKAVKTRKDLVDLLEPRKAGETAKVSIRRGEEELELEVRLAPKAEMFTDQMSRNDAMSGRFSKRRSGFTKVIQHDILARNDTMGGPVLDLDGTCLGINIARANRSETFAIPAPEARHVLAKLAPK